MDKFLLGELGETGELRCRASKNFADWLGEQNISLAVSTYQSNRLLFVSPGKPRPSGSSKLDVQARVFDRPMGIYASNDKITVACRNSIWELDDKCADQANINAWDALFAPSRMYVTGSVDAHEIVVTGQGQKVIFANTQYDCLSSISNINSFEIAWRPRFLAEITGDDRAHLNGICLADNKIDSVTFCGFADSSFGWKKSKRDGGFLFNVNSHCVLAEGLSMPHSPRFRDDCYWLLNSGKGQLGYIKEKSFKPLCSLPGFLRGLAFKGNYAITGLSKLRSKAFKDLQIEQSLARGGSPEGACGLCVVNLINGHLEHYLFFEEPIRELFDVQILHYSSPRLLGFQDDSLSRFVKVPGKDPAMRDRIDLK